MCDVAEGQSEPGRQMSSDNRMLLRIQSQGRLEGGRRGGGEGRGGGEITACTGDGCDRRLNYRKCLMGLSAGCASRRRGCGKFPVKKRPQKLNKANVVRR